MPDASDFVTVATVLPYWDGGPPLRLTKRWYRDADGKPTCQEYDQAKWCSFEQTPVGSLDDLAQVIAGIGPRPRSCLIIGRLRDGVDPTRARRLLYPRTEPDHNGNPVAWAATIEDAAHRWLPLDIDSLPARDDKGEFDPITDPERTLMVVWRRLPDELAFRDCVWQWTSGAGFKTGIRMRLFFWLSRPMTGAENKSWLAPWIKRKTTPEGIIDGSIFVPHQPIYAATPIFDGVDDPVIDRCGIQKMLGAVTVPETWEVPKGQRRPADNSSTGTKNGKTTAPKNGKTTAPIRTAPEHVEHDDPKSVKWMIRLLKKDLVNGEPKEGEGSDDRIYRLVGRLKDGDRVGFTLKPETIAEALAEHWAPHFDRDWIDLKVAGHYQNEPGCGPGGTSTRTEAPGIFRLEDDAAAATPERRRIELVGDYLVPAMDAAEAAMIEQGVAIYRREDLIVRPGAAVVQHRKNTEAPGVRLFQVSPCEMREHMSAAAAFVSWNATASEWRPVNCPEPVANGYVARIGRWGLPPLLGIVNAPVLRPDGSVLDKRGYDESTRLIYAPGSTVFPAIGSSKEDAEAALKLLKTLVGTFPFPSDEARSVALAAILTATIRGILPTAPLFTYSAPAAGSGKGKIADLGPLIASGTQATATTMGGDDTELAKRISALLLQGHQHILIDNVPRDKELAGDFLEAMLTRPTIAIRWLGLSKAPLVPTRCLVSATGNNLRIRSDLYRRVLRCILDPGVEFPERRKFANDPEKDAFTDRPRLLMAALTIIRAFILTGSPAQAVPLGSFEEWSHMVRDPLIWLGEADPVLTQTIVADEDPEKVQLAMLMREWFAVVGTEEHRLQEIIELAYNGQPLLNEALVTVAGDHRKDRSDISKKQLGVYMSGVANRVVGEWRFVVRKKDGYPLWRLAPAPVRPPGHVVKALVPAETPRGEEDRSLTVAERLALRARKKDGYPPLWPVG